MYNIQDTLVAKPNVSKSEGPDGIHLLKELSEGLALPLKVLFDKTLKEGNSKVMEMSGG